MLDLCIGLNCNKLVLNRKWMKEGKLLRIMMCLQKDLWIWVFCLFFCVFFSSLMFLNPFFTWAWVQTVPFGFCFYWRRNCALISTYRFWGVLEGKQGFPALLSNFTTPNPSGTWLTSPSLYQSIQCYGQLNQSRGAVSRFRPLLRERWVWRGLRTLWGRQLSAWFGWHFRRSSWLIGKRCSKSLAISSLSSFIWLPNFILFALLSNTNSKFKSINTKQIPIN